MWELDRKEGWALKNQCFWTVVLEKTLERSLDCKEIKPVRPKGNHPWIFIERTYAKTSASILWPPDGEGITHWEGPWSWERLKAGREGVTEDEMVGWHHWYNEHGFEQTQGDSESQKCLACCSLCGPEELDTTEWLNSNILSNSSPKYLFCKYKMMFIKDCSILEADWMFSIRRLV